MSTLDDYNVSWEDVVPGWEPWEPDDPEPDPPIGCHYCASTEVREFPDPFGGRPCCEMCFARLIGDESDNPEPWRCGTYEQAKETDR